MTIDEDRIDTFIKSAVENLGFLCERYDFASPSSEINRRSGTVTVMFKKRSVAIEAIHDLREGDVELKIVRLDAGRKPDGWHVDRLGRRCRASLIDILTRRGIRNFGLKPSADRESDRQRFDRLLRQYAHLLETNALDILSGSADAFEMLEATSGLPSDQT